MPRGRPRKTTTSAAKTSKKEEVVEAPKIVCIGCGNANQSNFYMARDEFRSYFRKVPYCKDCINKIFQNYLRLKGGNYNLALYYTCRKIDLPYIHSAYTGAVENVNNPKSNIKGMENVMSAYMKNMSFADKNGWGATFDESVGEDQIDGLSSFDDIVKVRRKVGMKTTSDNDFDVIEMDADELMRKWGRFDNDDLAYLESEYMDWEEQLNGIVDKYVDIMVKQVCLTLNEIRHDRESGQPVEKKVQSLRNLIKDSGLSDLQKNDAVEQGAGMTIRDIEFKRPVHAVDPDFEDVDDVRLMVDAFLGGTSRAIGKENEFTARFDDEYSKYTIDIIEDLKVQYGLDNKKAEINEEIGESKEEQVTAEDGESNGE